MENWVDIVELYLAFLKFLYVNFSFPLFFLVFILLFRESILNAFKRLKSVKTDGKSFGFEFDSLEETEQLFKVIRKNVKNEYGDYIYESKGGGGGLASNDAKYVLLINRSDILFEHMSEKGFLQAVKDLYESYKIVKKNHEECEDEYVIKSDELIHNFYRLVICLELENKSIREEDVFSYQSFIKDTLNLRINLKLKYHNNFDFRNE
ncbi:hypothetical protein CD120_10225 [Staphylococcus saprophyticus]|uniref:hypothetical protein n=1 Tax=Staphylococcus saprophyticus TaxID=29385 RepID=UPI000CD14C7E|nr:hypothetical protein [Staphylococcus saprophyticus]PNZ68617.1 hypothetical protein CD120_10225 [Staphylococcus saprophyticus]